jgi:hypothetical protein
MPQIETLGEQAVALFILSIVFIIALMCLLLWFGWWVTKTRGSLSPYSKKPMILGVDLPISIGRLIEGYIQGLPQPENQPFDYTKAAVCRETRRIFPNAVKRGEIIRLGWDFLQERQRGAWVSWGSLPEQLKGVIRLCHKSLAGFQTEISSPNRMPQAIDQYYAYTQPGPLYVDVATKTLLGWKIVPGTDFEVLVVQKPDYESIDDTL